MKNYKTYAEAKEWINEKYPFLKSYNDYKEIPNDIKNKNELPLSPQKVYSKRKEWKGWGDFLGTDKKRCKKIFTKDELILFIKTNGIKNIREYNEFAKHNNEIPSSLSGYCKRHKIEYKNEDFFQKPNKDKNMIKNVVKKEKIKTRKEYQLKYQYLNQKYTNIKFPYHIDRSLGEKWENILYKENITEEIFLRYVRRYYSEINRVSQWTELSHTGKLNKRIPKRPDIKYHKPWSYFFKGILSSKNAI